MRFLSAKTGQLPAWNPYPSNFTGKRTLASTSCNQGGGIEDSMEKTRFILVATARSGSNQLVNYINQTKVARCLGEIFKKAFWDKPDDDNKSRLRIESCFAGVEEARRLHEQDFNLFWDGVANNFPGKHKYIGAKLFYEHRRNDDAFWLDLFRRNPIIIHLWRSQVLESFLSLVRAEVTGQWTIRDPSKRFERNPPLVFDKNRYINYRRFSRKHFARMRSIRAETEHYHEIEYGTVSDISAIGAKLVDIFGPTENLASNFVKQAPADVLENVENRSEAEKFLKDRLDRN
jgi:LPS sulfotransferase NodH